MEDRLSAGYNAACCEDVMKTMKRVEAMSKQYKAILVVLILAAAAVRFHGLFANTFHPDEALFARWARLVALWRDPLLQTQAVDKPPLLFYLQAFFYPLMATPVAWVARLPSLVASLLLVSLAGRLTWALYGDALATFVAVAFVALSPFTVQFSATAFTDPLMVTLLIGTLVAVAAGRSAHGEASDETDVDANGHLSFRPQFVAGFLFGLAVISKHQAWLFLPLVAGVGALRGWGWPQWRRWLLGLILPLLALFFWGLVRADSPSLWSLQLGNYGGIRPAWSWELWPRLADWGRLWALMLGSPVLAFLLVLALPVFLALLIYHQDWPTAYDQLFLIYILGYVAVHWFLAVPVWDRYLLPLVPLVGMLLGRFLSRAVDFAAPGLPLATGRRWLLIGVAAVPVLLAMPAALQARQGAFPVGGRPVADGGAAEVAAALVDAPYGTVLYDHWYSWQWRYHLFDSGVYVSWFPHADALTEDLRVFAGGGDARYLALPAADVARPVRRAVVEAGFELQPVVSAGDIVLYRVVR